MIEELLTPPPSNGPFFRFPDEATGMAALEAAGLLTEDGDPITASHTHALDVIGTITRGGEYDPETGEVIVAPIVLDGWHVNFAGALPEGWDEYVVEPANPVRVWA
jgi:hypothetical protein